MAVWLGPVVLDEDTFSPCRAIVVYIDEKYLAAQFNPEIVQNLRAQSGFDMTLLDVLGEITLLIEAIHE